MARGQYVELAREGEGVLWTVLGEFADLTHNTIAGARSRRRQHHDLGARLQPRLLHGHSVQRRPGRQLDAQLLHRAVVEPVHRARRRDRLGRRSRATQPIYDDNPDSKVWNFLQDSINGWYDAQIAAGKTPAQINAYLSQFDVWDRYDYNGNGNFDEPDGYIDTFQSVHAGLGEEEGGAADDHLEP